MKGIEFVVFLDTTEFTDDSGLGSARWDSLRRAVGEEQLILAVSEVTVRELSRQAEERIEKYNDHVRRLRQHYPDIAASPLAENAESYATKFRRRLGAAGVSVLPLPKVTHAEMLERDIGARRPFNRSGVGYRDALIWLSFTSWVGELQRDGARVARFVSGNRSDFANQQGKLHADLRADLPLGADVEYVGNLSEIVKAIRPSSSLLVGEEESIAAVNARAAGVAASQALRGFPFDDLPVIEPYPDLPAVDGGIVRTVIVDEHSVEVFFVDHVNGIQIWDAVVGARLGVSGVISRDFDQIPSGWRVRQESVDPLQFGADGTLEATITVDIRIDDQGGVFDSAVTAVLLQPSRNSG